MAVDYSFNKQEPMKIETLKLDPERLEVVKEILAQNRMILEMILEPVPNLNIYNGISVEELKNRFSDMVRQNG